MSDVSIDIREQLVRIDRMIEESRKFSAEQHKLAAEARKFDRERWFILLGAIGGLAGLASAAVTLLRIGGHG